MYRLLVIFTVATMILGAHSAAAQNETAPHVYYLDEITVTASPVIEGNSVTRYGETVSTVSARQIDDLDAQDLPSALRRVPGVTISRYNMIGNYGGGDGGAVFVRGHGSGRPGSEISTMFDGIPRFSGVWTHPLMDMSSIDVADRIEIQKSAQPVLNGNMSFSAVNIVPKRMTEEGHVTRVHTAFGSYATMGGELEHGGKTGDFDYYLALSRRQSDGQRDNADGVVQTVYGRVGYAIGTAWDASLQFMYNDNWANDPLPVDAAPLPKTQKFENDSRLTIGTLSHRHGIFSGTVKAYYDDGYIDWREWNADVNEEDHGITTFDNYGIRMQETVRVTAASEIVVGLDLDSYGGDYVDKRPNYTGMKTAETLSTTAPYLMVSHVFGDEIQYIPSAGIRYNISSEFGNQTGYQVGQVVRMDMAELHANYARTFNLPGVWTKIMYGDFWSFANNPDGWKELEAEYMNHFEVGGEVRFSDRISADLTYFHDEVTDALRVVPPPPPPPSIQNIGDYTTQGVETSVSVRFLRDLDTFLGASVMSTTPDEVPNAPGLSLSAGVGYTLLRKIRLNADAQYVAEQYVQGTRNPAGLAKVDGLYAPEYSRRISCSHGIDGQRALYWHRESRRRNLRIPAGVSHAGPDVYGRYRCEDVTPMRKLFALGLWIACAAALHPLAAAAQNRTVVVSTSMLDAAVREVLPADASVDVVSILPPSACPGHFDLSPRVLPMLKTAALVIRHDYQGILDEKIAQIGGDVRSMSLIKTTGSPLIPRHYSLLARHVSAMLVTLVPDRALEMDAALADIDARMELLAVGAEQTAAQWRGVPVIAATNAIEFCEWLGFTVVGELKRPEDTTPQDFANLVTLDVDLIVGNYQEGTESAVSLGTRMNIPVAVISNFPGAEGFGETYDDLFANNLESIRTAWQTR